MLRFYTMYFPFFILCILSLFDLFLVHSIHHREHDVLFLMKISITYQNIYIYIYSMQFFVLPYFMFFGLLASNFLESKRLSRGGRGTLTCQMAYQKFACGLP